MQKHLLTLKELPFFTGYTNENILELICGLNGYIRSFEEGQIIYHAHSSITCAGIILSGEVEVSMSNFDGNELNVRHLHAGQLIGSAYACCPEKTSLVTLISHKKSQILFLDLTLLFQCTDYSEHLIFMKFSTALLKEIAKNNIFQNERIMVLTNKRIRDKVLLYLNSLPKENGIITLPFNREELANYLGVERSALSRELGRMKQEGLIDYNKNQIILL